MNNTTTPTPSILHRAAVVLALVVGAPLALAGCTAHDTAGAADTAASSGLGSKWGSCMRDAGFEAEDPSDDEVTSGSVLTPPGVDQAAFLEAAQTCNQQIGVQSADSAQKDEWKRQYAAVDACIREEFPDAPVQEPGQLNYGDISDRPDFEERWQECLTEHAPDTKTQSR
ncbi:hypothetical protein [Curtobacterium sp. 179-B 9B NHS]|uniref:hypothetical protein n=1 Tax=Curtobacterium sp. 179-B 9B NHS TaxID=3374293 RepID=UPI003879E9B4